MSFREKIDEHPFFWLISAVTTGFLAALPVIATVMEFTGTETVKRGACIDSGILARDYLSRSELDKGYLSRPEVEKNYILRANLTDTYLPRAEVNSTFIRKEEVERLFILRSQCSPAGAETRSPRGEPEGIAAGSQPKVSETPPARAAAIQPPPAPSLKPKATPRQSLIDRGFLFRFSGCSLSDSEVTCDLTITNKEDDRFLSLESGPSRIIDEQGREYRASRAAIGASRESAATLPTGVVMVGKIQFEGVHPGTTRLQLLEIHYSFGSAGNWTRPVVKFHNIDL